MDAASLQTYNERLASMLSEPVFIGPNNLIHILNLTKF
jgi:hypothetical protein